MDTRTADGLPPISPRRETDNKKRLPGVRGLTGYSRGTRAAYKRVAWHENGCPQILERPVSSALSDDGSPSSFSVFICSVVAATLGTLTGFGIGLGFILTLSLLTPTILAPVSSDEHLQWVIAMVGVLTCGTTACERYKNIPIRWLAHLVAPTVFLSPLGVVLALGFETSTLQQIFALVFFVAGSQQLWTKWSNDDLKSPETTPREGAADMLAAEPQERVLLVCAGAASGFLGGLSGMGGPPMQVYIVARPVGMAEARAGISAYFTLIYVVNLATLVSARIPRRAPMMMSSSTCCSLLQSVSSSAALPADFFFS